MFCLFVFCIVFCLLSFMMFLYFTFYRSCIRVGPVQSSGGIDELGVVGVDFYHFGAHVRQVSSGVGHGENPAQVHHSDSSQRGIVHKSFINSSRIAGSARFFTKVLF